VSNVIRSISVTVIQEPGKKILHQKGSCSLVISSEILSSLYLQDAMI